MPSPYRDLTMAEWVRLSPSAKVDVARELCRALDCDLVFRAVETFELGSHRRDVALFERGSSTFALVPGGRVALGFDPASFRPSQEVLEDYAETAEDLGLPLPLESYLERVTTRPRVCAMQPMLVETWMSELGLEEVSPEAPEVAAALKKAGYRLETVPREVVFDRVLRVVRRPDGRVLAYRSQTTLRRDVEERLSHEGARLLSVDEWEYVCGAGVTSLFRWGDTCPLDRAPIHEPESGAWALDRAPNLFGLHIAQNPYASEVVAEPGTLRGGDGGFASCGGYGFFAEWLPLATAYVGVRVDPRPDTDLRSHFVRRVIPVE